MQIYYEDLRTQYFNVSRKLKFTVWSISQNIAKNDKVITPYITTKYFSTIHVHIAFISFLADM